MVIIHRVDIQFPVTIRATTDLSSKNESETKTLFYVQLIIVRIRHNLISNISVKN